MANLPSCARLMRPRADLPTRSFRPRGTAWRLSPVREFRSKNCSPQTPRVRAASTEITNVLSSSTGRETILKGALELVAKETRLQGESLGVEVEKLTQEKAEAAGDAAQFTLATVKLDKKRQTGQGALDYEHVSRPGSYPSGCWRPPMCKPRRAPSNFPPWSNPIMSYCLICNNRRSQ